MDIQTEKAGSPVIITGEEEISEAKHDSFQTKKLADTAAVEEQKLQRHDDESDRRWRVFPFSKKGRDKATAILKAVIISQMIILPFAAWLEHLFTTSEFTRRLLSTTGDLILHCPYWISFGIIASSLAWLWRRATVLFCGALGLVAIFISLMLYYYRSRHPEDVTQSQAHAFAFTAAFGFLYIDCLWWACQSRLRHAARLQQGAGDVDADLPGSARMSLTTMYHALNRLDRKAHATDFTPKKFVSRRALATIVLFDIVSLVYLPPDTLTDYISTLNCKVNVEDLHSNGVFYEFTARPRFNSSFPSLSYCPESQQWTSLIREMNRHAYDTADKAKAYEVSKAARVSEWDERLDEIDFDQPVSCVAWCFRTGEGDEILGLMSHPIGPEDLPEMNWCRGEHGYSGDCEATGLKLGFDVTKEGWMNDYLGWVHDAEDGPEGERWDGNRRVHWNGEELEFPELDEEEEVVVGGED